MLIRIIFLISRMAEIEVRFKTIKWIRSVVWVINVTLIITAICAIPIAGIATSDSPPEFIALVFIHGIDLFISLLVVGAGSFFVLILAVNYGGIRSYRGMLKIGENSMIFESKRHTETIQFSDIIKVDYLKDESFQVSWKLNVKNSKPKWINFLDINGRLVANSLFIDRVVSNLEIPIKKEILEVPLPHQPKGY